MKKYLPDATEVVQFVILFVVASVAWQLVGGTILGFVNKAKAKVA